MGASATEGASDESGAPSTATVTSGGVSADGTGTTADTTPTDSSGTPDSSEDDDDGPGIYYDLGVIPDTPTNGNECDDKGGGKGGGGGGGGPDFSFIWVANSQEGTVSKIDTQSLEEVGRYRTRADANGSPSRTSVNLNGDVAVANRTGGVVKIISDVASCPEPGNTSSGAADVKPFPDGCVDWFTPIAYSSNRPVAWTSGTFSGVTCRYENTKLWTSGGNGPGQIDVMYLDGETGEIEQTVPIPEANWDGFGIYGGASDADGNFWGSQLSVGHLVFVDVDSFDHEAYPMPLNGYGMTVDEQGRA
ncbi:MAG: hypothetical protein IAG13_13800, partial [Deltaproteobacteria bacterium]|nr:hypothetical protein [Nannocystaceae bacterium]